MERLGEIWIDFGIFGGWDSFESFDYIWAFTTDKAVFHAMGVIGGVDDKPKLGVIVEHHDKDYQNLKKMNIQEQIKELIKSQAEPKQSEMQELHNLILKLMPKCNQWYFDGKNEEGKQVAHPTIGYGNYTITYKDGSTREFFRIGLLANPTGLAVHIMGIDDKKFLIDTYGKTIGKAKVGSYGITFKSIKDINLEILKDAIQNRAETKN